MQYDALQFHTSCTFSKYDEWQKLKSHMYSIKTKIHSHKQITSKEHCEK